MELCIEWSQAGRRQRTILALVSRAITFLYRLFADVSSTFKINVLSIAYCCIWRSHKVLTPCTYRARLSFLKTINYKKKQTLRKNNSTANSKGYFENKGRLHSKQEVPEMEEKGKRTASFTLVSRFILMTNTERHMLTLTHKHTPKTRKHEPNVQMQVQTITTCGSMKQF